MICPVALPNVAPPVVKHDDRFRFPPPPVSTRGDLIKAFGFDPSVSRRQVERTMQQAMWMMNNAELQKQIDADPASGTMLAELLAGEKDDRAALIALYRRVLARRPKDKELTIALEHIKQAKSRGEALEDLLWSLINSAEFTVKR